MQFDETTSLSKFGMLLVSLDCEINNESSYSSILFQDKANIADCGQGTAGTQMPSCSSRLFRPTLNATQSLNRFIVDSQDVRSGAFLSSWVLTAHHPPTGRELRGFILCSTLVTVGEEPCRNTSSCG